MQETWVRSLGQKDPLEKGTATHSSILAWRISWTEAYISLMFYYSLKKTFIFSKDVNYFLRLIVDAVIYCKLVNYTKSTAQLFLFYFCLTQ